MKKIITVILLFTIFTMITAGCSKESEIVIPQSRAGTSSSGSVESSAQNLMKNIVPNEINFIEYADDFTMENVNSTDFAVRLLQSCMQEGENTLISPLSVLCALAMTANGAEGETLTQMEEVLGMSIDALNVYIYKYIQTLPESEKCKLSISDSIWFNEGCNFDVNEHFLQTNADFYGAEIYSAKFDEKTCDDINQWVSDNTNGMINKILDYISESAIMYLVNALAFDAEWNAIYNENQIRNDVFTCEDGTEIDTEFMYCGENRYLEDDDATGFIKYYSGCSYAFAALLPNEGVTVSEYVLSLTGEHLADILADSKDCSVLTSIPKFETAFDIEMSEVLVEMGMPLAFNDYYADFDGIGTVEGKNICINRVIHKTYISIDEKGTEAGAATVVEMNECGAVIDVTPPKEVYLD